MITIRKEYPRVRQYVKAGGTYYEVDLRRKHYVGPKKKSFSSRDDALEYARDVASKVASSGIKSLATPLIDPRLQAFTEQCAVYNKSLEQALETALAVWEKERKANESKFMSELLTLWVDDKTSNKLKPLRKRTEKSIRYMANMFKADFTDAKIKEIDQTRLEQYLHDKDVSNQTRSNIRNYLGQFFNWAIRKGYHDSNPAEKIEITVSNGVPKPFSVEQCKSIQC